MGSLPNFIVAGAAKCGTTTLCGALAMHPDIYVCEPKEPNFLAFESVYQKGWDWYKSLFKEGRNSAFRGEGSVAYGSPVYQPRVISRLAENLDDLKIIYIVRHPIARMESAFKSIATYGKHRERSEERWRDVPLTLEQAIEQEVEDIVGESLYFERVNAFIRSFSRRRVHVVFFEDYKRDPVQELNACFEFLGADLWEDPSVENLHLNSSADVRVRDTAFLKFMRKYVNTIVIAGGRIPVLSPMLKSVLRPKFNDQPLMSDTVREKARARVYEDSQKLLALCGKPPDYWRFE